MFDGWLASQAVQDQAQIATVRVEQIVRLIGLLRLPRCGSRQSAYDDFKTALANAQPDEYPILLVDSEALVTCTPWEHLQVRDGWAKPTDADNDQAQMMVQCMETWCVADRNALIRFFGQKFNANALPPDTKLEIRSKDDILQALVSATRSCGNNRKYEKGKRSFELVGELDAQTLRNRLPHFNRLCTLIESKL